MHGPVIPPLMVFNSLAVSVSESDKSLIWVLFFVLVTLVRCGIFFILSNLSVCLEIRPSSTQPCEYQLERNIQALPLPALMRRHLGAHSVES